MFSRYDISSNSPSGGMKEMVRSFSKRANRTARKRKAGLCGRRAFHTCREREGERQGCAGGEPFAPAEKRKAGWGALSGGEAFLTALMKLDVLHLDSFPLGPPAPTRPAPRRLEQELVVKAQLELRHARQVGPHFQRAQYLAP